MQSTEAKQTPLFGRHTALGAKMVPFAGFSMPLSYDGQLAEHRAVRTRVGLFDLSHMGELRLRGDAALEAVDKLVTNRVAGTEPGQVVYSPMCRPDGGIVDDLLIYHLEGSVLLVVNAANIDKDRNWIRDRLPQGVSLHDESDQTALIAVQGPEAEGYLSKHCSTALDSLGYYRSMPARIAGEDVLLSRTGYTGEDGFELYVPAEHAGKLWDALMDLPGMVPVGLAARDTLRFEVGYCLYGNDLSDETTPLEAGLGWTVKLKKEDFVGREVLLKQKEGGPARRLAGLQPDDVKAIPRSGYAVLAAGETVGHVTSGTFAPTLERGLAMGYLAARSAAPGTRVSIAIRNKEVPAEVVRTPFYRQGSRKT